MQRTLYSAGAVAATLMLLWAARAFGPAGALVNLLIPLPIAFVHIWLGSRVGLVTLALAGVGVYLLSDAASALAYLMQFGLVSLVLPLLLLRGWGWDRAVCGALVAVLGIAAIAVSGYASYHETTVGELVTRYVHDEVDTALALYERADLDAEQVAELRRIAEGMGDFMLETWPALAVVATGVVLLLTVLFLAALANGRYQVPGPPFRRWKTPEVLIWGLILAGFAVFFGQGGLQLLGRNVVTVLLPLYFLHGLAIVAYFFERKSLTPFVRALGYMLATLLNPLPMVVTALGVFDLWVDFRKPRIKKAT